ncbi:hypothetical protein QCA50_016966 [Cerrena zonata]|uniref:Uncharacterized protein n=1 Tax=Cerrena zonata TaxID=2478898 RepID=A0AAW0FTJ7_9APHY
MGATFIAGCIFAVEVCVTAFITPFYVDWDYEQYCDECKDIKVSTGNNSQKEAMLREKWGPVDRGTLRVDKPRTIVDRAGRIMVWILPEVLLPTFQAELHAATKDLDAHIASNLRNSINSTSWRSSRKLFGEDTAYIRSGFINISPGWYMPGHSAKNDKPRATPLLHTPSGELFLQCAHKAFPIMSGITHIIHPEQYKMGRAIQESIKRRKCTSNTIRNWPSAQTALSIISNRETPFHRDGLSRMSWYDMLTSIGPYSKAPLYLSPLALRIDNRPGTICAFSGAAIRHRVRKCNLPRISFAWYMRENVREGECIEPAGWMTQNRYQSGRYPSIYCCKGRTTQ